MKRKHKITKVDPGSVGESLGVCAGDFLLEIDGLSVGDVFDYRMAVRAEKLLVLVEKNNGEWWELDIEKDIDDDLGFEFESALMDEVRLCRNKCVFCFVDQQPPGLRESLYVKDDDPRLSFLHGNYVTLTNAGDREIKRITKYHLSPLRISVHTADAALRCKMMGNKNAGKLFAALDMFFRAGIEMHFQAVICKGINDGVRLDETIKRLLEYKPNAASLAIVPAGVTRFRGGGAANGFGGFTKNDAAKIIAQVEDWQKKCRTAYGNAFVYAADEWYILAGLDVPEYEKYENFPQLDNGVGMLALFEREFTEGAGFGDKLDFDNEKDFDNIAGYDNKKDFINEKNFDNPKLKRTAGIVTGAAAYGFMQRMAVKFETYHPNGKIKVFEITNQFFGETVTVSGLLTGGDIITQLKGKTEGLDVLFLPANAFRAGTETMLDGTTRVDLAKALNMDVRIGSTDGKKFYEELTGALRLE
jgi:putative radical SAM enzyme (TIGR03279 family)